MENTKLTTGTDKDFPFRALVVGHVGFGHLPGFSSPSCLLPSTPFREFQAGWGMALRSQWH